MFIPREMFNKDILSVIEKYLTIESKISCRKVNKLFRKSIKVTKHEVNLSRLKQVIQSLNSLVDLNDVETIIIKTIVSNYTIKGITMDDLYSLAKEYDLLWNHSLIRKFTYRNRFQNEVDLDDDKFKEEFKSFATKLWMPFIKETVIGVKENYKIRQLYEKFGFELGREKDLKSQLEIDLLQFIAMDDCKYMFKFVTNFFSW